MKKRVTAAILAAGMILSLAGCGSGSKEAATAAPEDTVQSTAAAGKETERDRERDPHRCGSYGERSRASGFN